MYVVDKIQQKFYIVYVCSNVKLENIVIIV